MPAEKVEGVVILGGGVLGFSTAYHLAKEGIPSQVIEMDSIAAKASGKADGMIPNDVGNFFYGGSSYSAGGAKRLYVSLGGESYCRFDRLHLELREEAGVDIQHTICPYLRCALSEEEESTLINIASEARNEGLDAKWISGDEARALENTLSAEVRGAVLLECRQVEPYRYTLALAQGAEKLGASISYAQAVGFRCGKNKVTSVILSTGREVVAGTVVIAMGPWSAHAASWLGLKLPLSTVRAQTLKMVAPKRLEYQVAFRPPVAGRCLHASMIVSPRVDGTLLVGYTEDRTETWDDSRSETWTDVPSEEIKEFIIEQAPRLVPILEDAGLVEHRAAVLGYPPAEGMVIGPVPKWENVYMAMIGDNGIAVSPAVGRIMTDLIVGGDRAKKAIEEVKSVRPSRFVL